MKIVVTAARLPFPLDKGDRLTVFHLLKHFSRRHELSLVCFVEPDQDPAWVEKFAVFCHRIEIVPLRKPLAYLNCATGLPRSTPLQVCYYSDPVMRQAVDRVVEEVEPDLLYSQLLRMGHYIEPYAHIPRVVAMNASMTLNYRRLAEYAKNPVRKLFYMLEHRKLRNFEPAFARRFDRVLLISKHDYAAIAHERPLTNVFFNPHGVDCDFFAPDPAVEKTPGSIVFSGNMGYAPNVDAITVFCKEVLPKIQSQVPNVKLSIVGADPKPEVRALSERFPVEVTGRLPDIRGFINRAEVGIAPMRIAAGLQNKVLEGMSMGLPMVITKAATEAIRTTHGENVFLADLSDDFANSVVTLLRDGALRARMGAAARRFILSDWTWETHFNELEGLFEEMHRVRKEPRRKSALQPQSPDRPLSHQEGAPGRP